MVFAAINKPVQNAVQGIFYAALVLLYPMFSQAQTSDNSADSTWWNNYQQSYSESYIDEAMAALTDNSFRDAELAAAQATQVIKVNFGVYSELQFQPLAINIESLLGQRRLQSLEQQFAYFEWLLVNIYRKDLGHYLAGAEILGRLYLAAAAQLNNEDSGRYLVAAKSINWRAISAIESRYGENSSFLPDRLYDIVLAHFYQISLNKRKGMTSYQYKSDSGQLINGWYLPKNESLRKSYNIGTELLQKIRGIYQSSDNPSGEIDAKLLTYLGDWEILNDNFLNASGFYQQAYKKLLQAGVSAEIVEQRFSRPMILPESNFDTAWRDQPETAADSLTFISWSPTFPGVEHPVSQLDNHARVIPENSANVVFDLVVEQRNLVIDSKIETVIGLGIEELQFLLVEPDHEAARAQIREEVTALRLRPKILDGKVADTSEIALKYVYYPQYRNVFIGSTQ